MEGSKHAIKQRLPISASYGLMDDATANAVECLVNLVYLIRLQASVPTDVLLFVDMAQKPLETLTAAARGESRKEPVDARDDPTS